MKVLRTLPLIPLCLVIAAWAKDRTPPPVEPATSFPAVEVHDSEKLAIAVDPYDTKEKEKLFRVDYLSHGVMPVRLIVTNNGDTPVSLRDARILFETPSGDRIQAAEPEDVERLMTLKERQGGKLPMPNGLPAIHLPAKDSNKKIEADFDDFVYGALVVEPHTTRAGFLFYDVSQLADPLKDASLYIYKLQNAKGGELFYFEIPFNKYLQSRSSQMK